MLAAVGVLPIIAYFGMASFLGWGGILLGTLVQVGRGLGEVLFLEALNERISSAFRATVNSMAQLGIRASFCLLGPLVGYGIDAWGLPSVLSALGVLFSVVFVGLLLPVAYREKGKSATSVYRADHDSGRTPTISTEVRPAWGAQDRRRASPK